MTSFFCQAARSNHEVTHWWEDENTKYLKTLGFDKNVPLFAIEDLMAFLYTNTRDDALWKLSRNTFTSLLSALNIHVNEDVLEGALLNNSRLSVGL